MVGDVGRLVTTCTTSSRGMPWSSRVMYLRTGLVEGGGRTYRGSWSSSAMYCRTTGEDRMTRDQPAKRDKHNPNEKQQGRCKKHRAYCWHFPAPNFNLHAIIVALWTTTTETCATGPHDSSQTWCVAPTSKVHRCSSEYQGRQPMPGAFQKLELRLAMAGVAGCLFNPPCPLPPPRLAGWPAPPSKIAKTRSASPQWFLSCMCWCWGWGG